MKRVMQDDSRYKAAHVKSRKVTVIRQAVGRQVPGTGWRLRA